MQLEATTSSQGGALRKALCVLMAIVLAVGLMPMPKQAWAAEGDKLGLAYGDGSINASASMAVESGNNSVDLAVKVFDLTSDGTEYVTSGYGRYPNAYAEQECSKFVVKWYSDSVSNENLKETDTLGWNEITNTPKWDQSFKYNPTDLASAADGIYKYYAVATYGDLSDTLECIVTKGTPPVNPTYAISVEKIDSNGGIVEIRDHTDNSTLEKAQKNTSVAVDIKPADGYSVSSVKVQNASDEDVSQAVGLHDNTSNYMDNGLEYLFTMPEYAVTVVVTFANTTQPATSAVFTFVAKDNVVDFANYSSGWVEVYDGTEPDLESYSNMVSGESGSWNQFKLEFGKTYTVRAGDGASPRAYKTYQSQFTPTAETATTQTIELEAVDEPQEEAGHSITLNKDEGIYSLSADATGDKAEANANVKITVVPYDGMMVNTLVVSYLDGETTKTIQPTQREFPNDNMYDFLMPDADVTITATSTQKILRIIPGEMSHGTVSANPDSFPALENGGDEPPVISLTIAPDPGYKYKNGSLSVKKPNGTEFGYYDGVSWKVDGSGSSATITFDTSDFSYTGTEFVVSAEFEAIDYAVNVSPSISGGTVTADSTTAHVGETVTLNLSPALEGEFGVPTVIATGGVEVPTAYNAADGTYSFTMPASDVNVTAVFVDKLEQVITVSAEAFSKTVGDAAFSLGASALGGAALTYASSDPKVASVDGSGRVTVGAAGTATITISAAATGAYAAATKAVTVVVSAKAAPATNTNTNTNNDTSTSTNSTAKAATNQDTTVGSATAKVDTKADGTATVTSAAVKSGGSVTVDTVTVGGVAYKVTEIAASAFKGTQAKSITVGDSVTTIGKGAFQNAKKLTTLTLGKGVKTVGKNALKGAKKLKKITLKTSALNKKNLKNLLKGSKVKTIKLKGVSKKAKKNYKKWAKALKIKVK